jgi:hypothetical protein
VSSFETISFSWLDWVLDNDILQLLAVLFLAYQLVLLRRQNADDHERSRRLQSLETLKWFVENLKSEHHRIGRVLDSLNENEIQNLYRSEQVKFDKEWKEDLTRILSSRLPMSEIKITDCEDGKCLVNTNGVASLRFITISYLNLFEVALVPLYSGVADEDIIRNQMASFFLNADGTFRMIKARNAWGEAQLPNTFQFIEELRREKSRLVNKPKIGSSNWFWNRHKK